MTSLAAVFSLLTVISLTHVHVTFAQSCVVDNFAVMSNFDMKQYAGRWYEMKFLPPYFEAMYTPWTDYYEEFVFDNTTGVPKFSVSYDGKDMGSCVGGDTSVMVSNLAVPAKMYRMATVNSTLTVQLDFWILGTDYTTYSVIYGCAARNADGTCNSTYGWVESRTRTLTNPTTLNTVNSLLSSVCLGQTVFPATWQNSSLCPETVTVTTTGAITTTKGLANINVPMTSAFMLLTAVAFYVSKRQ